MHTQSRSNILLVWTQRVRARLIADRKEEVEGVAKMIYSEKQGRGEQDQTDGFANWVEAENQVIRSTFERQTGCTLSLTSSMLVSLTFFLPLCLTPLSVQGLPRATGACICFGHRPMTPPSAPPPNCPPPPVHWLKSTEAWFIMTFS